MEYFKIQNVLRVWAKLLIILILTFLTDGIVHLQYKRFWMKP